MGRHRIDYCHCPKHHRHGTLVRFVGIQRNLCCWSLPRLRWAYGTIERVDMRPPSNIGQKRISITTGHGALSGLSKGAQQGDRISDPCFSQRIDPCIGVGIAIGITRNIPSAARSVSGRP